MMQHEQKAGRWETWRAVVVAPERGGLRATMTLDAIEFFHPEDGWVWRASHRTSCWCGGTPHDAVATSAHAAVLVALASFGRVHDTVVEEIRGPGALTTADQVAAAVRRESEACAQVCDGVVAAENREGSRRRADPALAAGASLCVDRATGARDCAVLIRDRADDAGRPAVDGLRAIAEGRATEATVCRWRQCSRCGRCFWLADDERVPPHATHDDARLGRPCERPSSTDEGDPA